MVNSFLCKDKSISQSTSFELRIQADRQTDKQTPNALPSHSRVCKGNKQIAIGILSSLRVSRPEGVPFFPLTSPFTILIHLSAGSVSVIACKWCHLPVCYTAAAEARK